MTIEKAVAAVSALRTLPWDVAAGRFARSSAPAADLSDLLVPWAPDALTIVRASPQGGAAPRRTWIPLVGARAWEPPASWTRDPGGTHDFGLPPSRTVRARPDLPGADLLRVWMLGRLTCVFDAALAAWRGDAEAARAAGAVLSDFIERNPVGRGPHWASAMEVGLRAVRLLWASALLRDAASRLSEARAVLPVAATALARHEAWLLGHSDWKLHRTGNHHLIALAARFLLSCHLPPTSRRARETRRAWRWFWCEFGRQFGPDGVHFESSLAYHALCGEAAAHVAAAGRRHGHRLTRGATRRLAACAHATATLARGDGTLARFGDSDDGAFLDLTPRADAPEPGEAHAVAALLAVAADVPPARGLADASPRDVHAVAWLFGSDGVARLQRLRDRSTASHSTYFAAAGVIVLARPQEMTHVTVSAMSVGRRGTGGHGHDDVGSFELWSGRPLVVDRGTGSYTGDVNLRERLRSAASHSVVQVDGLDQNPPVAGRPFRRVVRARPVVTAFDADAAMVEIGHHGYFDGGTRVAVLRRMTLHPAGKGLEVVDEITGAGRHDVVLRIQWAPDLHVEADAPSGADWTRWWTVRSGAASVASVELEVATSAATDGVPTVRTTKTVHSPRMGETCDAATTELRLQATLPATLRHRIAPLG